jgi:transposase-like protein
MASHNKYSAEFKRQAVELAKTGGKSHGESERELRITAGLLSKWKRRLQSDGAEAFPGNGRLKDSDEEVRRLRRELEIVMQERDILKKLLMRRSHTTRHENAVEWRMVAGEEKSATAGVVNPEKSWTGVSARTTRCRYRSGKHAEENLFHWAATPAAYSQGMEVQMQALYQVCCGLDVHKRNVVACLVTHSEDGVRKELGSYSTVTRELLKMADWLMNAECAHVAMESTGVYWKPVFNVLDGHGAVKTRNCSLQAQFHRISKRWGRKRAVIAVAHSLLVIVYHVLRRREPYRELGMEYYDQRDHQAVERRLVRRLQKLGYQVALTPIWGRALHPNTVRFCLSAFIKRMCSSILGD